MKIELTNRLSTLTTIDQASLDKLLEKVIWCISDSVEQCIINEENTLELNSNLGSIILTIESGSVKYKFIPSEQLNKAVVNTIVDEKNLLELNLEQSLVTKITNLYKDLF